MNARTLEYIKSRKPQLDVLGQWVYLANARTGSTSLTGDLLDDRVIIRHRGTDNWERVWNKVIVPRIDDVVLFTFVRNPWDRVVSAWKLLQMKGRISTEESLVAFIGDGGLSDPKYEHFFRPQHLSFMTGGEIIREVTICRHESRQEDWRRIADRIGVASALPQVNATEHEHYSAYYDVETVKIVERFYATEIGTLGYSFGE